MAPDTKWADTIGEVLGLDATDTKRFQDALRSDYPTIVDAAKGVLRDRPNDQQVKFALYEIAHAIANFNQHGCGLHEGFVKQLVKLERKIDRLFWTAAGVGAVLTILIASIPVYEFLQRHAK